ncbi:MAG: leucine-rich repeat protein, partial [Treponemataceae bacterium]|nr:leucine-rich repeat protein [Treponemataceae bacterium]
PTPRPYNASVTFHSNAPNGTVANGTMSPQAFTAGQPFTLAKNEFSIEGYTFRGWTDSPSKEEPLYTDEQEITLSENIALYAVWQKTEIPPDEEKKFTVTFYANAPDGTVANGTMPPQTFTEGLAFALSKNEFSIEGYTFRGWTENASATEATYADEMEITLSENIALYAVWEKDGTPPKDENTHTVTFIANAPQGFTAQGSMPPQSSEDSWLTLKENAFSVPQHIFKGWATDASSKEVAYEDEEELFNFTEDIVLYAVWEYWLSVDEDGNIIVQQVDDIPSDVVIPEGVTTIGETIYLGGTFTDIFENFTTLTIPSTLKNINTMYAFTNMKAGFWPLPILGIDKRTKGLPFKFIVDENNPYFKTNDSGNMLLSKDGNELYFVTNSSSDYTIPSTVRNIKAGAFIGADIQSLNLDGITLETNCNFQNCTKLTSVVLKNITVEGSFLYAFQGCTDLQSADLSESGLKIINQGFFSGCMNLKEVKLPSGLEEFNYSVFGNCKSLESLTIPESLKTIKGGVFDGCAIKTINFKGTAEQWNAISIVNDSDKEFLKSITIIDSSGNVIVQN